MWPSSAVVVDLPLVPVMPAKMARGQAPASSSPSPMIGQPASFARATTRMGLRMGVRDAGAEDQGGGAGDIPVLGIDDREAVGGGGGASPGVIVPGAHRPTGGGKRPGGRAAADAQTQHRVGAVCEMRERNHRSPHLSFRLERPIRARTEAMIQKRMTMVGSAQPFFSK